MMCGKLLPSEYILEKMKTQNSLVYKESLERDRIFFVLKYQFVVFSYVYLKKKNRGEIKQNEYLFSISLK